MVMELFLLSWPAPPYRYAQAEREYQRCDGVSSCAVFLLLLLLTPLFNFLCPLLARGHQARRQVTRKVELGQTPKGSHTFGFIQFVPTGKSDLLRRPTRTTECVNVAGTRLYTCVCIREYERMFAYVVWKLPLRLTNSKQSDKMPATECRPFIKTSQRW